MSMFKKRLKRMTRSMYRAGTRAFRPGAAGKSFVIHDQVSNNASSNKIKGNGRSTTYTLNFESYDFKVINISCSAELHVLICDEPFVKITADENIVELFEINQRSNLLFIDFKDDVSFSTKSPLKVEVGCLDLQCIMSTGSGDITVSQLDRRDFELSLYGSGDTSLSGVVDSFNLNVSGSGDVLAANLESSSLKFKSKGSGDIRARATNSVTGQSEGSGDITIYGNPAVNSIEQLGSDDIFFKR